jgi:hypothetical protein
MNDACLLSDLQKPPKNITKTDKEGRTIKKSKMKNLGPILFVKTQIPKGKKRNGTKARLIKTLIDSGARKTVLVQLAASQEPAAPTN